MNLGISFSWSKLYAYQFRFNLNLPYLCSIFVAIGIIMSPAIFADTQDCSANIAAPDCGGPLPCLPQVKDVQAVCKKIEIISTSPPPTQIRYTFAVYFSGSGWHQSLANQLRVMLYANDGYSTQVQSTIYSQNYVGNVSVSTCVTIGSEVCVSFILPSTATTISFWANASETNNNIGTCGCTSTPVSFDLQSAAVVDTLVFALPTAQELGPVACESHVGDPINVTNGNMFLVRDDFVLPSDLGPTLRFQRYYNSFSSAAPSMLNANWRHSLEYYLDQNDSTGDFLLTECTGRQVTFLKHTLVYGEADSIFTTYSAPYQTPYRFVEDTDHGIYTVILLNDDKLIFDGLGWVDAIQDVAGHALTLTYEADTLQSIENASGRRMSFNYDAHGLKSIESSDHNILVSYDYDSTSNHLQKVTLLDGSWEEYQYGSSGYDANGIVEITNSESQPRYFEYDINGRAILNSRADSDELVELSWDWPDTCGCKRASEIFSGYATYQTDDLTSHYKSIWAPGDPQRIVIERSNADCPGCASVFAYDASGMKAVVEHPNGRVDSLFHDSRGNLIQSVLAAGTADRQPIDYKFDSTFNKPTYIARPSIAKPSGGIDAVQITYDSIANPTQIDVIAWKDASVQFTHTTQFTYNASGQLIKYDGPRVDVGDTVKLLYYPSGDLRKVVFANGDSTVYGERDDMGRRPWVRAPNGDSTETMFDAHGRLTQAAFLAGTADSARYIYEYSGDGQLTAATLPLGGTTTFDYDGSSYLDQILDPLGSFIDYDFDSLGNLKQVTVYSDTAALRYSRIFNQNPKHQLERMIGPYGDTTFFSYSAGGELEEVRDANSVLTKNRYDILSRLTERISPWTSDSAKTTFTYDSQNNVTKVIDPDGNTYVYRYDDKGRLTVDSCAVTGKTLYGYDPADNLVWKKNAAGDSLVFQYDALNRLTAKLYPDAQNVYYQYDSTQFNYSKGRLYKDSTASVRTTYRYDSKGRLYQEIRRFPSDTLTYTTTYGYDKNDNLISLTYPSGNIVEYFYDAADNCTGARTNAHGYWSNIVDNVSYAPFGAIEKWRLGNGIKMTNRYNLRYEIDSISTDTVGLVDWLYSYEGVGNIEQIRNLLDTLKTRYFAYDELSRLVFADSDDFPDQDQEYEYSLNGNRISKVFTDTTNTTTYNYTDNKLTSLTGAENVEFTYDALGNIIKEKSGSDSTLYEYDDVGHLTAVVGVGTTTFGYDAYHRRVRKSYTSNVKKFIYSPSGQLLTEKHSDWWIDYVYLNGKLLALFSKQLPAIGDPGGGVDSFGGELDSGDPPPDSVDIYYYHNDHLGTPWFMTNESQMVVWAMDYYPFGEIYDGMANLVNNHRFPGQYVDETTDLNYNWHRYYKPEIGRYYQVDPIGLNGGINLYGYSGNNPLSYFDLSGLQWRIGRDGVRWFEEDAPMDPNYAFFKDDILDEYSRQIINPDNQDFIPIADVQWDRLVKESVAYFRTPFAYGNALELKRRALSSERPCGDDPGGFDIKSRPDLDFGMGVNRYTMVNGRILQNQDWGNILFGIYGREAGFPRVLLAIGAGFAQVTTTPYWRWGDWVSFFDNPRDQRYIFEGYR